MLPPNMIGLADEQIEELRLKDEWGEKCLPSGGWTFNKDVIGTMKFSIFFYLLSTNLNLEIFIQKILFT